MAFNKYTLVLLFVVAIAAYGCIESYTPPSSKNTPDILVVEGFLNSSEGSVRVNLTKATPLTDTSTHPGVNNATVYLEDSNNSTLLLNFISNGRYELTGLAVDYSKEYRIRIVTASSKEYASDFIKIKQTPDIDSITWAPVETGVEIRVNTHDDTGNSRYYLWSFEETWQYRSPFPSNLIFENFDVRSRTPSENITNCWKTQPSTKVLVGSSERLTKDVISQEPIHFLPEGSQRLSVYYSTLVRQTAISADVYDFYEKLRKTTEELGGLFDPQPGKVVGNIHNVNDDGETVLGIFNGGDVKEKRIFISHYDLPVEMRGPMRSECTVDSISIAGLSFFRQDQYNLVGTIVQGPTVIGYTYASIACTDCRFQGGVNVPPSFWP
jgi:hypothetical protein